MTSIHPSREPDRLPIRATEASNGEEPVPCPPMLTLTNDQVYALVARAGMPEWAIEPCLVDFVLGATGSSERRPLDVWRRWAVKHVLAMWTTPGRRPQKPESQAAPVDASALRRARRAALRSERERAEQTWREFTAGACLPTPEQAAQLAKVGIKIPSRPNSPGAASGLSATELDRSPTGVRTSGAPGASEGHLGAKGAV